MERHDKKDNIRNLKFSSSAKCQYNFMAMSISMSLLLSLSLSFSPSLCLCLSVSVSRSLSLSLLFSDKDVVPMLASHKSWSSCLLLIVAWVSTKLALFPLIMFEPRTSYMLGKHSFTDLYC